jgi:sugar phosphate isomerase/epimerase
MYLSCSCLVCAKPEYPTLADALAKIRELGFGAADLDVFENWQHVSPSELAAGGDEAVERVARTVAESGLDVDSMNCGPSRSLGDPAPESFAQYKAEFAALLALAERIGCPNITLQPGPVLADLPAGEQFAVTVDHLRELSAMAGDQDVLVSLEGHAGTIIERPESAVELMERVWPSVGFTYDPSHPVLQDIDLERTRPLLKFTDHVHVRNASSGQMQATMADGTVDFAWLVEALRSVEYFGAVAIEYFDGFDADFTSTLALRDRLRQLGVGEGTVR